MTNYCVQPLRWLGVIGLVLASSLTGCVAQTTLSANSTTAAATQGDLIGRVIIKFRSSAVAGDSAETLAALQRDCGVPVTHARPVGAGAHLYELSGLRDQAALEQAVKSLAARSDIEFAEIDRLMKPATPSGVRQ